MLRGNTPAVLRLYTRDLKCFVSRSRNRPTGQFCDTSAVPISDEAPARPDRVAQNAGCMMAIHAICTKSKILTFYKLLIFKDFI